MLSSSTDGTELSVCSEMDLCMMSDMLAKGGCEVRRGGRWGRWCGRRGAQRRDEAQTRAALQTAGALVSENGCGAAASGGRVPRGARRFERLQAAAAAPKWAAPFSGSAQARGDCAAASPPPSFPNTSPTWPRAMPLQRTARAPARAATRSSSASAPRRYPAHLDRVEHLPWHWRCRRSREEEKRFRCDLEAEGGAQAPASKPPRRPPLCHARAAVAATSPQAARCVAVAASVLRRRPFARAPARGACHLQQGAGRYAASAAPLRAHAYVHARRHAGFHKRLGAFSAS
ncbi:hypothetical protein FGB62_95g039 [Gracilaria domingensis]|nr:hypothetical protein FGB62_95g039 [Gracilaria domingensis]